MSESVIQELVEGNPIILIILEIISIVLIASSEELLFRVVIQGRLRERFEPYSLIITASLLFELLHLLNLTKEILPTLLSAFIIVTVGGILGWLYKRSTNIIVPIFVYGIYNFILFVVSYFALV